MKKALIGIILIVLILLVFCGQVLANQSTILEEENTKDITVMKEKVNSKVEEYAEKYNSETYGLTAYILNLVRWYSIPICFIGIVVGAIILIFINVFKEK